MVFDGRGDNVEWRECVGIGPTRPPKADTQGLKTRRATRPHPPPRVTSICTQAPGVKADSNHGGTESTEGRRETRDWRVQTAEARRTRRRTEGERPTLNVQLPTSNKGRRGNVQRSTSNFELRTRERRGDESP